MPRYILCQLLLCSLLFFSMSCISEKQSESLQSNKSIKSINFEVHIMNENFLFGFPRYMEISDSLIYIYDNILKKKINVFKKNGQHLLSFCEKGENIGQIKQVANMGLDPIDKSRIYVYDNIQRKIIFWKIEKDREVFEELIVDKLNTISNSNEVHVIDDDFLFFLGNINIFRYSIFNRKTKKIISFNQEFPNDMNILDCSDSAQIDMIYNDYAIRSFNLKMNKFVSVTSIGESLEIFKISNENKITKESQITFSIPLCNNKNYSDEMILLQTGFYDVDVTDSYIFAVLGHVKWEDEKPRTHRNTIYMFDWNGNVMKKITTNININRFKVDESKKTIYVIGSRDQEKIKLFKIDIMSF